MINLENFKPIKPWPTTGFMHNDKMFSDEDFAKLKNFNFRKCQLTAAEGNRKSKQYWRTQDIDPNDPAEVLIKQTLEQLDDWEVLKALTLKALANEGLTPSDVWTGDIDDLKDHYLGVFCAVHEDDAEYYLTTHLDSRPLLQVYIEPDGAPVGTYFYEMDDYSKFVQLPFKENTGYFQLHVRRGWHSVRNIPGVTRRSIIFGWNMMFSDRFRMK
jgi:hypothetical protein